MFTCIKLKSWKGRVEVKRECVVPEGFVRLHTVLGFASFDSHNFLDFRAQLFFSLIFVPFDKTAPKLYSEIYWAFNSSETKQKHGPGPFLQFIGSAHIYRFRYWQITITLALWRGLFLFVGLGNIQWELSLSVR